MRHSATIATRPPPANRWSAAPAGRRWRAAATQGTVIGGLFGRQSRRTTETEMFLFLTPRVLRTDAEVGAATDPVSAGAGVTLSGPAAGRRP